MLVITRGQDQEVIIRNLDGSLVGTVKVLRNNQLNRLKLGFDFDPRFIIARKEVDLGGAAPGLSKLRELRRGRR